MGPMVSVGVGLLPYTIGAMGTGLTSRLWGLTTAQAWGINIARSPLIIWQGHLDGKTRSFKAASGGSAYSPI